LVGLPGHDGRSVLAAAEQSRPQGQRQAALGRLAPVAVQAPALQDGRHPLAEQLVGLLGARIRREDDPGCWADKHPRRQGNHRFLELPTGRTTVYGELVLRRYDLIWPSAVVLLAGSLSTSPRESITLFARSNAILARDGVSIAASFRS